MTGSIARADTLLLKNGLTAKHLKKLGLHYQNPKKQILQIKLLEFASSCNLSHQHLYRVLIKAHATQGYCFSIFSLVDLFSLTLIFGMH